MVTPLILAIIVGVGVTAGMFLLLAFVIVHHAETHDVDLDMDDLMQDLVIEAGPVSLE